MKQTKTLLLILCMIMLPTFAFATNYSMEERSAYDYAYKNDITTMPTIDKANMEGNLTRIAMAKMLSNYAINILGLTPDTTKDCSFPDVSSNLDKQYDYGVTKACQLGLMGVGINQFYPNGKVTRAEFGTVLSRALNAKNTSKLNQMNNASPYYSEHLKYLNEQGIMNNISSPNSIELRGWVMIMLMRADRNSNYDELAKTKYFRTPMALITNKNKDEVIVKNTDELLYRNEVYGFQVLLDKYRGDGKICNWVDDSAGGKEIAFHKLGTFDYGTGDGGMIDSNTCRQVGYRVAIYTTIYDNNTYDTFLKEGYDGITGETGTLVATTRGKNNKYHFIVRDGDPRLIRKMFTNVSCYQVEGLDGYSWKCPNHLDTIFLSNFSIFDVSEITNVSTTHLNKYPNAQKYCLDNNRKIITNDYGDEFCSKEDGAYYELRAYEEYGQAGWRGTDEPYCSIYEEPVCGVDGISYTNECWLKDAGIEKDSNAKFVNGKCVSK